MATDTTPISAATKLRSLLAEEDKIIVCPGVYDGFTARIALAAGFDCIYMVGRLQNMKEVELTASLTGAGTTMSMLGQADLGIATLNDMVQNASMIAGLNRSVPLIADADTGYGGPLMVGRTTAQYMQAGVAAFHLEDQVQTKRCGHLRNKELVDEEVYLSRIKAAVNMRAQTPGDVLIIARTDALQSLGFEVALERLKRSVAIGADVAFLEGIATEEEARRVCKELNPTPVLLNNVAGGLTPSWTVQQAKDIGFRLVIYPGFALGPVYQVVAAAAKELKETGDLQVTSGTSPKDIFGVCGLNEAIQFDVAAGGNLYSKGV